MDRRLVLVAAGGSAVMLGFALVSQYAFGLFPCPLCIWQRWPHLAAVLVGLAALLIPGRVWPWLGALAAVTTAGIGGFHAGVEQGWWDGLQSCAGGMDIGALSLDALLDPTADVATPPRCDQVAASFLGLSMAVWNMLFSLGLAGVWVAAARRSA
jgi:disulfide bond formation protein DsbB